MSGSVTTTEREHDVTNRVTPASSEPAEPRGRPGRGARAVAGWTRRHRLLLSLMTAGLVVRLWDLAANLPVMHHPDEPANLTVIEHIAHGDPNPHFFNYPSLFLYLQSAVSLDGPLLGWLIPGDRAVLPVANAMGSAFAPSVYTVLVHRALSVACGVALVGVVWAIARKTVAGTVGPAVAAGLVALSPDLIEHSRYVTPDIVATLVIALGVLAALHVFESGSARSYLLAGAAVGLATSAKYNAALVAVAVVAAFLVRFLQTREWRSLGHLVLSGVAALVAFLLTTPYALLDRAAFLAGVEFERAHYATGHAGMDGDTPAFYAGVLLRNEGAITVPALIGIGLLLAGSRVQRHLAAVLLAFPLVYAAFVFSMPVRNERTIMVVLPVLAVFAGYAVSVVAARTKARQPRTWQRPVAAVGAGALAVAVLCGVWSGLTVNSVHDARVQASKWVADNLPAGSSILVESYSPWIDPQTFHVTGRMSLLGEVPEGTDYVVASEAMFGRFTDQRDQFPNQAAAYDQLFASLRLVREFSQAENSIRIYQVPRPGN
jgi:4-amino-4-deoxy-L-arabinose transferase-like glycosyltransferase